MKRAERGEMGAQRRERWTAEDRQALSQTETEKEPERDTN